MNYLSLLGLCLGFLTQAAAGPPTAAEPLLMFALEGDTVTLPCGIPSIKSCSSVNWLKYGQHGTTANVADDHAHVLQWDCSLKITHLVLDDARLYSCVSGTHISNVSLQILNVTENLPRRGDAIELQCVLNTFIGYVPCNIRSILIKWSAEDDTPIRTGGDRFTVKNSSDCFSKLIIKEKPTDHHRKWKCHLTQNGEIKATIDYKTTVKDGIEEVFGAVGESVSLTCGRTSSYGVEWAKCEKPMTCKVTSDEVFQDSSLVISKLTALHAGDYQCSEATDQQSVLNKIRLHTLDVTAEPGPEGENLTLTCVLTCAKECDKEFNLSWSGSDQKAQQSRLMRVNNTLKKEIFLPDGLKRWDEMTCSVHREGALMASKKWHTVNPLQTAAWLVLPLGLLICVAAGGVYMKRKHNKDAANEHSSIGMTHVYDVIQDVDEAEPQQRRQNNTNTTTTTTHGFYDLLQPVNEPAVITNTP